MTEERKLELLAACARALQVAGGLRPFSEVCQHELLVLVEAVQAAVTAEVEPA